MIQFLCDHSIAQTIKTIVPKKCFKKYSIQNKGFYLFKLTFHMFLFAAAAAAASREIIAKCFFFSK